MKKTIISIIAAVLISGFASAQTIYYVNGAVSSSGSGNSWATAFKTIQEGINAAESSLTTPASQTAQVWVKQGTYYVYVSSNANTIDMLEGVEIYGGFAGTETQLSQRNYETNVTILDGHQSSGSTNKVKHVVTAFGTELTSTTFDSWTNGLLDGFTVTGGSAGIGKDSKNGAKVTNPTEILNSGDATAGGGILIFKSAPTIQNCIISENSAGKGGGMYIMSATTFPSNNIEKASIKNCTLINNHASMRGGGLSIDVGSEPKIESCKFIRNSCDAKGGGVYIDWVCPKPAFINCLFVENTASSAGAIGVDGSSNPFLINCTITNNETIDVGAGIYAGSYNADGTTSNEPTLINCIVSGNSADWGGPVDLRIWHDDYFYVSHSILGTGFTSFGEGISYNSPSFTNIANSDYTLALGSAGIDEGTASDALDILGFIPTTDINGDPRDANPDMGCYEYISTNISDNVINSDENFDIYPNPASDILNIMPLKADSNYNLSIYNNIGEMVISENFSGQSNIDISNISSGIYFVMINVENQKYTKKIVVR